MSRFGKLLPVALAVSVLLNVFVLGWGAVRFARRGGGGRAPGEMNLPSAARQAWEEHAPRLRAERRAVDEQRAAVASALRHDPFDPAALEAGLLAWRNAQGEREAELHRMIVEVAPRLTPDERERLAHSRLLDGASPHRARDER